MDGESRTIHGRAFLHEMTSFVKGIIVGFRKISAGAKPLSRQEFRGRPAGQVVETGPVPGSFRESEARAEWKAPCGKRRVENEGFVPRPDDRRSGKQPTWMRISVSPSGNPGPPWVRPIEKEQGLPGFAPGPRLGGRACG